MPASPPTTLGLRMSEIRSSPAELPENGSYVDAGEELLSKAEIRDAVTRGPPPPPRPRAIQASKSSCSAETQSSNPSPLPRTTAFEEDDPAEDLRDPPVAHQ